MAIEINNNEINLYSTWRSHKAKYYIHYNERAHQIIIKRDTIYTNVWQQKINMDEINFYMLVAQSKTLLYTLQ